MKVHHVALIAGAIISFLGVRPLHGDDNSCVSCHSKLPTDTFVGSQYHDWRNSIHQEYDVTCEKCHGGSAQAKEKDLAHKGMYNSGDPRSAVYFKNVPGTCGGCHEEVYLEFIQSNHYKKLERTGSGPTCVTCHGSKATWIVTPQNIKAICVNCHNERKGIEMKGPDEARVILLALNQSISLHALLDRATRKDGGQKVKEYLDLANAKIERARLVWHSFDLEAEVQLLLEANEELDTVKGDVLKK